MCVFVISLVIGLWIYRDFGLSWDEPQQRQIGYNTYDYIASGDRGAFDAFEDKDYGVAFELPLVVLERALRLEDTRDVYFMRHLVTHLCFLLGAFCMYLLAFRATGNAHIALLTYVMFLASPLTFSHSFFNTKDVPFMSMYVVAMYAATTAFQRNKPAYFALAGLACALLTNLRVMGVLLVACVVAFLAVDVLTSRERAKSCLYNGLVFTGAFALVLYATWPLLWGGNPIVLFAKAFEHMSQFRWGGSVLLGGQRYKATDVPWDYFPIWFSHTVPLPWLALGSSGIALLSYNVLRRPLAALRSTKDRTFILFLLNFSGPIVAVWVFGSVLYDGWRQVFFVYPPFLLLAAFALDWVWQKRRAFRVGIVVLVVSTVVAVVSFLFQAHPFGHVYFNLLVPHEWNYVKEHYEMDYWGTSYRMALEHVVANDSRDEIKVKARNRPGELAALLLEPSERKRLSFVKALEEADYYVTNFRGIDDTTYAPEAVDFRIVRQNSPIVEVVKLR